MSSIRVVSGDKLRWNHLGDVVIPGVGAMMVGGGPRPWRDIHLDYGFMSSSEVPRKREHWEALAERVREGHLFVVESNTSASGFIWDEERGTWVVRRGIPEDYRESLSWLLRRVRERHEYETSALERLVGAGKELVNRLARENAALLSEHLGGRATLADGRELTVEETAELFRRRGSGVLPVADGAEAEGAAAMAALPAVEAIVAMVQALGTRGRSVVRDPRRFAEDLRAAMRHARSEAEVLGKLGKEQAKRRLGHASDARYVDRYHGPDDLTRGPGGRLAEWEAKGSAWGRPPPAKAKGNVRQGSAKKNRRRAKEMVKNKARKVGQPSGRQGGPYTAGEIELWSEIERAKGQKQHYFVHTDTREGRVRVYRQDKEGRVKEKIDDFYMEDFEAAKKIIGEVLGR